MFTGIVEEVGSVKSIIKGKNCQLLEVKASKVLENTIVGDSIAINGVCQTVVKISNCGFIVDVLHETLKKTNLGKLRSGKKVNLERAITVNKPLGGHFVQGHIQSTGIVSKITNVGLNTYLSIKIPQNLIKYMVTEGSIAVDGLSLTIAEKKLNIITINVIPHTLKESTFSSLKVGDQVNIEPDILIKSNLETKSGLTKEKLIGWGY